MRACVDLRPVAVLCIGVALLVPNGSASTSAAGNRGSDAKIDVSARIGGRYQEPTDIWVNPCEGSLEFRSDRLESHARVAADGVTEGLWQTWCYDPTEDQIVPSTINQFWVGHPIPGELVPRLFEYIPEFLDPPTVEWPNMSPEHGWLFVKVPMDFRVSNLEPVTITATVTNLLGSASASVTATPDRLAFVSGEGGGAECSAEEARQAYVPTVYGACSYRYVNSSAIAGGAFSSRTTMFWTITSNPVDSDQPTELETFTTQSLAVSEVQAVVACSGSDC